MIDGRPRHDSVVRLGERPPTTAGGALAILGCWLLLVLGVVVVPTVLLLWALITAGPIEVSGPRPPFGAGTLALFEVAVATATASAIAVLAITVVVTARGGRLVNGWIAFVLSLPVVAVLWDIGLG